MSFFVDGIYIEYLFALGKYWEANQKFSKYEWKDKLSVSEEQFIWTKQKSYSVNSI